MADVVNFPKVKHTAEVLQAFRLLKAFLAITDPASRAHLLDVAEALACGTQSGDDVSATADKVVTAHFRGTSEDAAQD